MRVIADGEELDHEDVHEDADAPRVRLAAEYAIFGLGSLKIIRLELHFTFRGQVLLAISTEQVVRLEVSKFEVFGACQS